jgi:hypothetical protein
VGGRRSQRPGPSPTLVSLGPSHHRRHKSRVSLRGPLCALGVLGISYGEVRDTVRAVVYNRSICTCHEDVIIAQRALTYEYNIWSLCTPMLANTLLWHIRGFLLPFVYEIFRQHVIANVCMAALQVANDDTTMFSREFQVHALCCSLCCSLYQASK